MNKWKSFKPDHKYTVQFPTREELVKHPDFETIFPSGDISLQHQIIFKKDLGQTRTFSINDMGDVKGTSYTDRLLIYVKILEKVKLPTLEVESLDYYILFGDEAVEVGCQTITRKDALKIFKKLGDWLGYEVEK